MANQKIKNVDFVTAEGILGFPLLFPGQAKDGQTPGSKAYTAEWSGDPLADAQSIAQNKSIIDAVTKVAQQVDAANWQKFVYAPYGVLKRLEEYPGRTTSKYPYAAGKFVLNMSKTLSLKSLKMEGADLSNPAVRAEYDRKIAEGAPKVRKFANWANPMDVQVIHQMNQENLYKGLPAIVDGAPTLIPVRSDEIWAGCIVRLGGQAYYEGNFHKKVLLNFDTVLLCRQGERLVGESNPDATFGGFAPPADLAPPPAPVAAFAGGWGEV